MAKDKFCRLLSGNIKDEADAHDEYIALHTAAWEAGLGDVASQIEEIMSDETQHKERLKEIFREECEGNG